MAVEKKFIRINSMVRPDQHKYVKVAAKKAKVSEGEMYRTIVDFFINNQKKTNV